MSTQAPGLHKLNIPQKKATVSPKTDIANNLRAQSPAKGTSWGIFAQRTMTGLGVHYNNRQFNSSSISATRHALNDNRTEVYNNTSGFGHVHKNNQSNGINPLELMSMMSMLDKMKNTQGTKPTNRSDRSDILRDIPTNDNKSKAKSLKDLQKNLDDANKKVGTFADSYAKTDGLSNVTTSITDIKKLVNEAGVNVNISDFKLSELNLTANSSLSDIDTAINAIQNTDIASIDTFSGSLGSAISTIDEQLKTLSQDKENAGANSTKISKLQSAKAKLETLRDSQLPKLKTNLTEQKNKLTSLRNEKAGAMDKVYNEAQTNDTKIGKNNSEMEKLKTEIEKETDKGKKNKLIKKYNGLADDNKKLQTDLSGLASPILNSNGETLTLSNLSSANTTHYVETTTISYDYTPSPNKNPDETQFA